MVRSIHLPKIFVEQLEVWALPANNMKTKSFFWIYLFVFLIFYLILFQAVLFAQEDIYHNNYEILEKTVNNKKMQLNTICEYVKSIAKIAAEDDIMLSFFKIKSEYYQKQKDVSPPKSLVKNIAELKQNIQTYYFENYSMFYDAIMVDTNGDIFYTIRQEDDYHQNIFEGRLANTNLSAIIKKSLSERFVDFQYFIPSKEPAAFFVAPVYIDGHLKGWLILQWAINKINSLFKDFNNLGATGEVILVNKEHFILTNSRFTSDFSSLKLRLNSNNISSKFKERKGHKIITDYRGVRALSYFEVFNFLGVEWLISAKKDEDEVLTEYYKLNKNHLYPDIIKEYFYDNNNKGKVFSNDQVNKVDMEEFVRGSNGEILYTKGVSTCTGVIVSCPGKFSYMAHVSPYDKMYSPKVFLTNLVEQILKRLPLYEICMNESQKLRFYIIANHTNTIENIVDLLTDHGFLLSQIHYFYKPEAERANVYLNTGNDNLYVWWIINSGSKKTAICQTINDRLNMGERMRSIYEAMFQLKK